MYQSIRNVYSRFEAYATQTFMQGEKTAIMQLDVGIGKWVLIDGTRKMMVHHDMPTLHLLSMLRMLFPNNELIKRSMMRICKQTRSRWMALLLCQILCTAISSQTIH